MLVACLVSLIAILGLKIWAAFTLMYDYRPADYRATAKSRRLYAMNLLASVLLPLPIVVASYASGLWWIELPAWLLFGFAASKVAWAIWMRASGKHLDYYRRHQWE